MRPRHASAWLGAAALLLGLAPRAPGAPPFYTLRREVYAVSGVTGGYLVRHPRRHPAPYRGLIMVLHGLGGAREFRRGDRQRLEDLAGAEAMLVAYPEAPAGGWPDPGAPGASSQPLSFVLGVAEELTGKYGIPPDQVYWIGVGPGGRLVLEVAAIHPDRARAAAIFGMGTDPSRPPPETAGARRVPLLFQRGSEDPVVPFRGGLMTSLPGWSGSAVTAARVGLRELAAARGCDPRPEVWTLPDPLPMDGVLVRRVHHDDCPGGGELVLYEFHGAGHGWPACDRYHRASTRGKVSMDYAGADLAWGFFGRHGRPATPPPDPWEGRRLDWVYGPGRGDPQWFRPSSPP